MTYICLCNWTQKGIESVKESPKRLDGARGFFKEMGVELKSFHLTSGRYDFVIVLEAKDEASVARAMLAQASKGSIRTETLRAFSEEEYRKILGSLP